MTIDELLARLNSIRISHGNIRVAVDSSRDRAEATDALFVEQMRDGDETVVVIGGPNMAMHWNQMMEDFPANRP